MHKSIFDADGADISFYERVKAAWDKNLEPFRKSLEQENDRAFAIISTCLIDNLLERIIRTLYIKDPAVKSIFRNDRLLQSTSSKIYIAYFSGLLPKAIYHDLKIVCEIRNKFAHETTVDLTFDSDIVTQKINGCEIRPRKTDKVPLNSKIPLNRLKFMLIVEQLMVFLCYFENLLINSRPANLVDSFKLNDRDWGKLTLTGEQITEIFQKRRSKNN